MMPDLVLNDFCLVAGTVEPTTPTNRRYWFRNVFTEPVGFLGECEDPAAPLEPRGNALSTECQTGTMSTEAMPNDEIPVEEESTAAAAVDSEVDDEKEMTHDDEHDHDHDHDDHDHDHGHGDDDEEMMMEKPATTSTSTSSVEAISISMAFVSMMAGVFMM